MWLRFKGYTIDLYTGYVIPKHRINQMPVRVDAVETNERKIRRRGGSKAYSVYFLTRLNNSSPICQKAKVDD